MRKQLLIAIAVLLLTRTYAQEQRLYLTPDDAPGLKASNLFMETRLIPLETNKASYFNNMADFVVTPDRFVFLDNQSNTIFIFNKQGQFLHKYKKKKYTIGSLQYSYSKNAICFISTNKNYTIPLTKAQQMMQAPRNRDFSKYINIDLLHLNTDENYRVEPLPVPPYALRPLYYINGKYLMQNNRYNKYSKDTILYHLQLMNGNETIQSYFPFLNAPKLSTDYEDLGINIDRTLNDSTYYIQKNYDNTIYKLVHDSLQPQYRFVFPSAQTMPAGFYTTAFKNNIDFSSFKTKNGKVIRSFYNIIDLKDHLFFGMNNLSYTDTRYVFNKKTSILYNLSKITSDSSTFFLPANAFSKISNYDAENVYTYISGNDLLKEKDKLIARYKNGVPPALAGILEQLTKFSNPVIIQLKIQTNPSAK